MQARMINPNHLKVEKKRTRWRKLLRDNQKWLVYTDDWISETFNSSHNGYDFHPKSVGDTDIYIAGLLGDGVIILTFFLLLWYLHEQASVFSWYSIDMPLKIVDTNTSCTNITWYNYKFGRSVVFIPLRLIILHQNLEWRRHPEFTNQERSTLQTCSWYWAIGSKWNKTNHLLDSYVLVTRMMTMACIMDEKTGGEISIIQLQTNKEPEISTCKAIGPFVRDFHLIVTNISQFFIYHEQM